MRLPGSYSSAEDNRSMPGPQGSPPRPLCRPLATRTFPSGSSVAVWPDLPWIMSLVAPHVRVRGS